MQQHNPEIGYASVIALDSTPDTSSFVGTETADVNESGIDIKCSSSLRLQHVTTDEIVLEETSSDLGCLPLVYVSIKTPVNGTILVSESLTPGGTPVATSAPTLRKS
jgi:hypothetical protein